MSGESAAPESESLLEYASAIAAAYVRNNPIAASELPGMIRTVHAALAGLSSPEQAQTTLKPAVPVKRSVTPDYIVCLEDGARLKMLKRYLRSRYDLSPEAYRTKWGLPHDYPMVAPNYSEARSQFAKTIGLGKMPGPQKTKKRRRG